MVICKNCKESKYADQFAYRNREKGILRSRCKCCEKNSLENKIENTIISLDGEIWKNIKGYEKIYMISNFGRVKSLFRTAYHPKSGNIILKGNILSINTAGPYKSVELSKNSIPSQNLIHRLVAIHFIPNPKNKSQVNHINGIKKDNDISNLEWVTPSENSIHALETKLKRKGQDSPVSKLSNDKVKSIKRLLRIKPKINKVKLAEKLGISNSVIHQIIRGDSWKHITI